MKFGRGLPYKKNANALKSRPRALMSIGEISFGDLLKVIWSIYAPFFRYMCYFSFGGRQQVVRENNKNKGI